MKTVGDFLRDADPLRHEPLWLEGRRDRLRQTVVVAAADVPSPVPASFRTRSVFLATALIVAGIVAIGSHVWSPGATLTAAVRFEVRLAEAHPGAGLREARVAASDRLVYLHKEIIATNTDVERCTVVEGDGPSDFGVAVQFNAAGAKKMRQVTMGHVGRPVAILIDGSVVIAPVLRSPVGTSAVISGVYTKAEAERIVNGIGIR